MRYDYSGGAGRKRQDRWVMRWLCVPSGLMIAHFVVGWMGMILRGRHLYNFPEVVLAIYLGALAVLLPATVLCGVCEIVYCERRSGGREGRVWAVGVNLVGLGLVGYYLAPIVGVFFMGGVGLR